jgi:hypothetical protein
MKPDVDRDSSHDRLSKAAAANAGAVELLFVEVRRALAEGRAAEGALRIDRLRRVLEVHFSLEDRVYFPALQSLLPSIADDLRRLGREHEAMLEALGALRGEIHDGPVELRTPELDALAVLFAEHEEREEAILQSLDGGGT